MATLYETLIRPLLSRETQKMRIFSYAFLENWPVSLHYATLWPVVASLKPQVPIRLFGLKFQTLSVWQLVLTKMPKSWNIADLFWFRFAEVGTVTAEKQPGNTRPRLLRYPEEEALINRMGFNNEGAQKIAKRLSKIKRHPFPLGVNIGKSKTSRLSTRLKITSNPSMPLSITQAILLSMSVAPIPRACAPCRAKKN